VVSGCLWSVFHNGGGSKSVFGFSGVSRNQITRPSAAVDPGVVMTPYQSPCSGSCLDECGLFASLAVFAPEIPDFIREELHRENLGRGKFGSHRLICKSLENKTLNAFEVLCVWEPSKEHGSGMLLGHQQPLGMAVNTGVSASILSPTVTSDEGIGMHTVGLKEAKRRLADQRQSVAHPSTSPLIWLARGQAGLARQCAQTHDDVPLLRRHWLYREAAAALNDQHLFQPRGLF
jgi:hypothetical protein